MSLLSAKVSIVRHKLFTSWDIFSGEKCKGIAVAGLLFYLTYILLSNNHWVGPSAFFTSLAFKQNQMESHVITNIGHIVFGIAGSANTWRNKKPYIEVWWRPNMTRGFLWLDRAPKEQLPWSLSSPPFKISEDINRFNVYNKHGMPFAIRMVRVILESFREDSKGVRWYVMADDDTVLFVDNLVEVLARYDHNNYYYIGHNSECIASNYDYSFQMAFGGAGYALSFPLAKAIARNLDDCLKRYPYLYGSDHILQSCISDLGVALTHERGFHQIDLHGDLSGLLSAHPPVPALSLHHLDHVDPIFPSMNRHQALKHLMEAAKIDSSRLFQQAICYQKQTNWSFSVSWGYSVQIYEKLYPPSVLEKPLQTFFPWKSVGRLYYVFNTRPLSKDPCEVPHLFFFDSVEDAGNGQIITSYTRRSPRRLPPCLTSGNHSVDLVMKIRVTSPSTRLSSVGRRKECCDVAHVLGKNVTEVKVRGCMKDEIVA